MKIIEDYNEDHKIDGIHDIVTTSNKTHEHIIITKNATEFTIISATKIDICSNDIDNGNEDANANYNLKKNNNITANDNYDNDSEKDD